MRIRLSELQNKQTNNFNFFFTSFYTDRKLKESKRRVNLTKPHVGNIVTNLNKPGYLNNPGYSDTPDGSRNKGRPEK